MNFTLAHSNINVCDLEKSIEFYKNALGLEIVNRHKASDGSFELAFLANANSSYQIELTWLCDKEEQYNLGDNESHIAFITDEIEEAHELHEKMGCICYENKDMGLYFIEDPDGYWLEIIPAKK